MGSRIEIIALPTTSPGCRREVTVHRFGPIGGRPKVYLQAGLHADELPGMLVLHHLLRQLAPLNSRHRLRGEIVVVPVANPIGLSQSVSGTHIGRYELSGGGNFNRGWRQLAEPAAERLAGKLTDDAAVNRDRVRAALLAACADTPWRTELDRMKQVLQELMLDADFALDLHCDEVGLVHMYTAPDCLPEMGPLAAALGAEAVLLEESSGGQPFDESASGPWIALQRRFKEHPIPLGCASATIELRGKSDVDDEQAAKDAAAILGFLARRGFVLPETGAADTPEPTLTVTPSRLDAVDVVKSPAGGLVIYRAKPGDRLGKGDVVAEILDPTERVMDQARIPVATETEGLLLTTIRHRLVRPGDVIAKVVGRDSLPSRRGNLLDA